MARPPLTAQQRSELDAAQRSQIISGLAKCITEGSYAATRIVDVASAAKVSKTTVYAHYADKEEIFAALYEASSQMLLQIVRDADRAAADAGLPWRERVAAGAAANIDGMLFNQALTRSMLVEAQATSPRMLALRREAINGLVDLMLESAAELHELTPEVRLPPRSLAVAALGGVRELILEALDRPEPPDRDAMVAAASDFLVGFMRVDPGAPAP